MFQYTSLYLPHYFYIVLDNLSCFNLQLVWIVLPMTNVSRDISYPKQFFCYILFSSKVGLVLLPFKKREDVLICSFIQI